MNYAELLVLTFVRANPGATVATVFARCAIRFTQRKDAGAVLHALVRSGHLSQIQTRDAKGPIVGYVARD